MQTATQPFRYRDATKPRVIVRRTQYTVKTTRRGEIVLPDGRKIRAEFGRQSTQRGAHGIPNHTRQNIRVQIDGRTFSGIQIDNRPVKLNLVSNLRIYANGSHERIK